MRRPTTWPLRALRILICNTQRMPRRLILPVMTAATRSFLAAFVSPPLFRARRKLPADTDFTPLARRTCPAACPPLTPEKGSTTIRLAETALAADTMMAATRIWVSHLSVRRNRRRGVIAL